MINISLVPGKPLSIRQFVSSTSIDQKWQQELWLVVVNATFGIVSIRQR